MDLVATMDSLRAAGHSMTNELAKALHQFATHSSTGAGKARTSGSSHFRRRQF
jgi:hypothetical protein